MLKQKIALHKVKATRIHHSGILSNGETDWTQLHGNRKAGGFKVLGCAGGKALRGQPLWEARSSGYVSDIELFLSLHIFPSVFRPFVFAIKTGR